MPEEVRVTLFFSSPPLPEREEGELSLLYEERISKIPGADIRVIIRGNDMKEVQRVADTVRKLAKKEGWG